MMTENNIQFLHYHLSNTCNVLPFFKKKKQGWETYMVQQTWNRNDQHVCLIPKWRSNYEQTSFQIHKEEPSKEYTRLGCWVLPLPSVMGGCLLPRANGRWVSFKLHPFPGLMEREILLSKISANWKRNRNLIGWITFVYKWCISCFMLFYVNYTLSKKLFFVKFYDFWKESVRWLLQHIFGVTVRLNKPQRILVSWQYLHDLKITSFLRFWYIFFYKVNPTFLCFDYWHSRGTADY